MTIVGMQNASGDLSKLQMDESLPGSPSVGDKQQSLVSHACKAQAEAGQKIAKELQEVLRHASSALLRLAQPETISGLESYCNSTFEPLYQLASARKSDHTETADDSHVVLSDSSSSGSRDVGRFSWMQALALQVCVVSAVLPYILCIAPYICNLLFLLVLLQHCSSCLSGCKRNDNLLPLLSNSRLLPVWRQIGS